MEFRKENPWSSNSKNQISQQILDSLTQICLESTLWLEIINSFQWLLIKSFFPAHFFFQHFLLEYAITGSKRNRKFKWNKMSNLVWLNGAKWNRMMRF